MGGRHFVPPPETELSRLMKQVEAIAENEMMHGYGVIQGITGMRLRVQECLDYLHNHFQDNTDGARQEAKQSCLDFAALALVWALQIEHGPPLFVETHKL